jgi:hypothetical protein
MNPLTILRRLRLPARLTLFAGAALLALAVAAPLTALAAPKAGTTCDPKDIKCVIAFGDQRIQDRLDALTKLNGKVTDALSAKHITSDQANALTSDIATNTTGLQNLKAKLDGESDIAAARGDVKNVYLQFRIYAVVLPRDYHELWLDRLTDADHRLAAVKDKIADAIAKAPSGEQAQLNSLFDDYKTQLAAAEAQMDAAQGELPQFTPENFNTNRQGFETARTNLRNDLKSAHKDLKQAAGDLHQIAQILKGNKSGGSGSPTATAANS